MSASRKALTITMWSLVVAGLLGLIALERFRAQAVVTQVDSQATTQPLNWKAPTFRLTDQSGQPFESTSLEGKVWTAMLFFTECPGVCPGMTMRIKDLQKSITDPRVHFVSLTVDPERDTPAVLAEYAQEAKADPQRWHLLTGSVEQMKQVAAAFKLPYDQPTDHSSRILLIDAEGSVVDQYRSSEDSDMARLKADAQRLLAEGTP